MAVSAPTLIGASATQFTGAQASQTSNSFSLSAGQALVMAWAGDNASGGGATMSLSGGVGAPNVTIEGVSPYSGKVIVFGVWVAPGAGSYTVSFSGSGTSFQPAACQAWYCTNVDGTTPADGTVQSAGQFSGEGDGDTSTGTFNITSAAGDLAVMGLVTEAEATFSGGTELFMTQIGTTGTWFGVQTSTSVNPSLEATGMSGQSGWCGLSMVDGGGGGGGGGLRGALAGGGGLAGKGGLAGARGGLAA